MRKIVLRGSAKTVCTDFAFLVEVPDDISNEELDRMAWEESIENAGSYGWDYTGSDELLEDDEYDQYVTDSELEYYWEEYDPEKHDGIL